MSLSKKEKAQALNQVSANKEAILKDEPEAFIKLKNDIELVSLESLIKTYETMLGKNLQENRWQTLFDNNPFILSLAFGYPIIKIQSQVYVGGRKITGKGEKISDFLVENNLTHNAALIEIKTPTTALSNKREYRDGVYNASSELSGSINQILDQRLKFQQNIFSIKDNSELPNLKTYSVHGILIIGKIPENNDKKKSFELFRGNSKDITIITFDELLEKLKHLHSFLKREEDESI